MHKHDLVDIVYKATGTTRAAAERAVDELVDAIVKAVAKGEKVTIAGLGIFERRERKARKARNPRTGETVRVPATKVPRFRPAKSFKDRVAKKRA